MLEITAINLIALSLVLLFSRRRVMGKMRLKPADYAFVYEMKRTNRE